MSSALRGLRHGIVLLLCAGCASVSKESVELSHITARRIADMQASHERLLLAYFQVTRDRIDDFLQHHWIPTFLVHFVKESGLLTDLRAPVVLTDAQYRRLVQELSTFPATDRGNPDWVVTVVNSALGDPVRGQLVLEFTQAATAQIEKQRRELIGPINAMERAAFAELRSAYADLMQMQGTLTAFIQSVHDVRVEEDRVLEHLGLLSARDRAVQDAVDLSGTVMRITEGAGHAEELMRQLRERLGLPTPPINQ
jgi:hypothetical protein